MKSILRAESEFRKESAGTILNPPIFIACFSHSLWIQETRAIDRRLLVLCCAVAAGQALSIGHRSGFQAVQQ
jgi:hypothetical protein